MARIEIKNGNTSVVILTSGQGQDTTSDKTRLPSGAYSRCKERPSSESLAFALSYRSSTDSSSPQETLNLVNSTMPVNLPVQDNENTFSNGPEKITEISCSVSFHFKSIAPTSCKDKNLAIYLLTKERLGKEYADYLAQQFEWEIGENAEQLTANNQAEERA